MHTGAFCHLLAPAAELTFQQGNVGKTGSKCTHDAYNLDRVLEGML